MSKRILITGGAGFIGFHLATRLAENRDHELLLVDNFDGRRNDPDLAVLLCRRNVQLVRGDLTNPFFYQFLHGPFDEVYHLAAVTGAENARRRPHEVIRIGGLSTLMLLDWFVPQGHGKLLFASTSEVYSGGGNHHDHRIAKTECAPLSLANIADPQSSIAGGKIYGELAVTHLCEQAGLPYNIIRYHNVYGPRMNPDHAIADLVTRARAGETPLRVDAAQQSQAYCYVSDAVEATIAAMKRSDVTGHELNVGHDAELVAMDALARQILRSLGRRPLIESRTTENPHVPPRVDTSRARALLDFQPRVSLAEGIERTLAWYGHRQQRRVA